MSILKDSAYDDHKSVANAVREGRHREAIGGMWTELGNLQFQFMKDQGLLPCDTMLDIGCGSLRGGIHFIKYLDPGNYFGLDANKSLLDAGYDVELAKEGLQHLLLRDNLRCDAEFAFSNFKRKFNFALAQSVFTHLSFNRIRQCLENLAGAMKKGGVFYATFFELPETHQTGQSRVQQPGGIVTYGTRDPFHYRFSDFIHACSGLPWAVSYLGQWNHPRGQRMIQFQRLSG